jgi:N-acetylglucosaminyl-diphospho-decaprenol L-rhamnosyltransferase
MIELSIIIVSFNARADLERCLASLHETPPALRHEIIVVDNASTDGSPVAAQAWRDVRVIERHTNGGFAVATNVGIRASRGELLLLLNSDTVVPAGAIDRLVTALRSHADAAVAGPRLVDANGVPEWSFGAMLTPWTEWRRRRVLRRLARNDRRALAMVDAATRREQWPDWVTGACLLVNKTDAEAVGLLDERYFMYMEDVDFCAALRGLGRRILFTPAAEVVHLRGRSAAAAPAATRAAYERSHLAFYEKHHPRLARMVRLYRGGASLPVRPTRPA